VLPDGSITFTAEMRQDEVVHFGYASVQGILAQGAVVSAAVREFAPQAIHLYSCGCRRFLMQEDVQLELAPFAAIAPTAGFFTFGEFCHLPEGNPMLNAALVVAAMREGPAPSAPTKAVSAPTEIDLHLHSHVRILSRFQHFSQAITRDLEQANRELAVLADHDSLTGLPNRRKLHSLLAAELARVSRYSEPFCIAMCDADHFKRLNDQFGHGVGDETLKVMARTLREECREADMVCRYGGEEFLILMPATRLAHAIACIERVRTVMESVDLRSVHPDLPPQTMSFGIAAYGEHGDTESALLSAADAALYQAKRSGRNRVCVAVAAAAPNDGN
jgi:diguanylate cyclase (GGDEF)-like protein